MKREIYGNESLYEETPAKVAAGHKNGISTKSVIALLLAVAMCISIAGCAVDEEALEDLAKDQLEDMAGDVLEDVQDNLEASVGDLIDDIPSVSFPQTGPTDGESQKDVCDCAESTPYRYDAADRLVLCQCGGVYAGVVDYETFKTLVDPQYNWFFHGLGGISEYEYYSRKYAHYLDIYPIKLELGIETQERIIHFEANGGIFAPQDQYYNPNGDFLRRAETFTDEVPERQGYRFCGWSFMADTEPHETDLLFGAGDKLEAKNGNRFTESMTFYAIWETCENHTYELINKGDNEICCKHCLMPHPVEALKFSTFLQYYYPGHSSETLSREEKEEAVKDYVRIKSVMMSSDPQFRDAKKIMEQEEVTCLEVISTLLNQSEAAIKMVTLQNTSEFFMCYNVVTTALGDVENSDNIVSQFSEVAGILSNATSFSKFLAEAQTFREVLKRYDAQKEGGKPSIFGQKITEINVAVANANAAIALAEFAGGAIGFSGYSPPIPSESLLNKVTDLGYDHLYGKCYFVLTHPFDKEGNLGYISTHLMNEGKNGFSEINIYDKETVLEAMKQGPSARDLVVCIPELVQRAPADDQALIEEALWFYYGWRVQYEYELFLNELIEQDRDPVLVWNVPST